MTEHAEMASISCATLPEQHRAHRTAATRADDEEVGALLLRDLLERRYERELQRFSLAGRRCSTGLRLWCLPSSLSS